ncbi:L-type lectin-domain containing receptor kinase VIII.2-like [Argentina anserina]|uniref:L-type lectin-domain containing receptor kinase VIII.2-like n=1 Tax=Argentina anserina TaxID=57926 RepID=UPI0021765027|nr:L-type lectin-domain containing receptor kinase VIII.2-like [Potentilla anserina]
MAKSTISSCSFPSILLLFPFYSLTLTLIATPISSSSLQSLPTNPNFDSQIALLGDAADGGAYVNLTRTSAPSSGLLLRRKPFKLVEANLSNPVSFSSELVFSITPGAGDGIVVVFSPGDLGSKFSGKGPYGFDGESRFLGIEFDTEMNQNVNDVNANHIGVNVGSFVSVIVGNVSELGLVLNSGEKMKSWIDYDASSKRLEIRLSKMGDPRPYNPIVAYGIDFSAMWKDEDVNVGISSSNSNGSSSSQISSVYSWSFRLRNVPRMHSLPVNPRGYWDDQHGEDARLHKPMACPLSVLAGIIFMTGCGALVSFVVLFLWAIIVNRHTVFPAEFPVKPNPTDFRYEKISVVVEEDADGDADAVADGVKR